MFKDSNLNNNGNRVLKFFFSENSDIWTIGDSELAVPEPLDFTFVFLFLGYVSEDYSLGEGEP